MESTMASTNSAVDLRLVVSASGRRERSATVPPRPDAVHDVKLLQAENARLAAELERLRQENGDLREAAEIWIRMYENQLSRANRAADLLAHCANALAGQAGATREAAILPAQNPRSE
jgi:hypothetical protein